jgi:Protein of unknown function (DUF3141)
LSNAAGRPNALRSAPDEAHSSAHGGIHDRAGTAKKEHGEFSSNIDLIDTLPPGLYEAVFEARTEDTANPNLMTGNWVMRCEARTLDDIRALGGNDAACASSRTNGCPAPRLFEKFADYVPR